MSAKTDVTAGADASPQCLPLAPARQGADQKTLVEAGPGKRQSFGGPTIRYPGLRTGWLLWRKGCPVPLAQLNVAGELPPATPGDEHQLALRSQLAGVLNYPTDAFPFFLTPVGMDQPRAENGIALSRFLRSEPKHRAGLYKDALAGNLSGQGVATPGGERSGARKKAAKRARKAHIKAGKAVEAACLM